MTSFIYSLVIGRTNQAGFDLRDVFLLQEKEERSSVLELWTSQRSSAGSLQRSVTQNWLR